MRTLSLICPRSTARLAASLAAVAALGISLCVPAPAQAATPTVLSSTSRIVTADALPTAQIDGIVWKSVIAGSTVFAGGRFANARPAGAAPGTNLSRRTNLMSYNIRTGRMTSFAPTLNGEVRALALSPNKKILYVGGSFNVVNGVARPGIAAFTVATGKLRSTVLPVNGRVSAIATLGNTVYFGGWFTRVGPKGVASSERLRLAAFNATTGRRTGWNPRADNSVEALVATPDRKRIIIGGKFSTLGGKRALGMGAVTTGVGLVRTWKINNTIKNYGNRAYISSLAVDKDTVYGSAVGYESGNYEGNFAARQTDGAIKWLQDCHGDQYQVTPVGDYVYSVGHAHFCSNIGGFGEIDPQRVLVVSKSAKGTVAKNTQLGINYRNYAGYKAPAIYGWFPKLNTGRVSGSTQGAWTVQGTSQYVVLGGEFTTVNGKPQQGLVRFTTPANGAPQKVGPQATGSATTPQVWQRAAGRGLQLGWNANYDLDSKALRYQVFRNGRLLTTFTRRSTFYNRVYVTYSDTTVKRGTRYTYKVRVSDADKNSVTSPSVTATA